MKNIITAKKFRYILAVVALVGCTSAFAADTQTTVTDTQNQYSCPYQKDCPYVNDNGQGRGHHHGHGYHH